jgi:ChaB protein
MPNTRRRGLAQGGELPGTLKRSSKEAQETFTKARDSAVQAYGEGDQADRAAYAEFKRTFEKRGDHWIPKQPAGPEALAHAPGAFARCTAGIRRRSPPCMRWRGPRLVRGRPGRLTGRLAPQTTRRGRTSARTAGFPGASRVPSVTSGRCPFPTVKAFLLPLQAARKVPLAFISAFFAVHISSTEDGWLSA